MAATIIVEVPEELQPLLPTFLRNRRLDVEALELALDAGDFAAIRKVGHNLKGVGGGYGFMQITEAGAQIERLAGAEAGAEAAAPLQACIADLRQFLANVEVVYITS